VLSNDQTTKAASASETSVNFYRKNGATTQKTTTFMLAAREFETSPIFFVI
jgi:hypothetical protein